MRRDRRRRTAFVPVILLVGMMAGCGGSSPEPSARQTPRPDVTATAILSADSAAIDLVISTSIDVLGGLAHLNGNAADLAAQLRETANKARAARSFLIPRPSGVPVGAVMTARTELRAFAIALDAHATCLGSPPGTSGGSTGSCAKTAHAVAKVSVQFGEALGALIPYGSRPIDLVQALLKGAASRGIPSPVARPRDLRPHDPLTGIGATRAGFAANHPADPDPRLASGCCFGPTVHNAGAQSGQDMYAPVQYGGGYVDIETINFDTGTPVGVAMRAVDQELPSDARLVRTKHASVCLAYLYRSDLLGRSTRGLGKYVTVSFYGRFNGNYNPDDVESAILATSGNFIGRC